MPSSVWHSQPSGEQRQSREALPSPSRGDSCAAQLPSRGPPSLLCFQSLLQQSILRVRSRPRECSFNAIVIAIKRENSSQMGASSCRRGSYGRWRRSCKVQEVRFGKAATPSTCDLCKQTSHRAAPFHKGVQQLHTVLSFRVLFNLLSLKTP